MWKGCISIRGTMTERLNGTIFLNVPFKSLWSENLEKVPNLFKALSAQELLPRRTRTKPPCVMHRGFVVGFEPVKSTVMMNTKEILKKIRRIEISTNRLVNNIFAGEYESVFKGRGMEFEEVREYQPGDEIRSIDWNVTARMGQPYVKKYVEERELVLMLLVDTSASADFGTWQQPKAEIAAEISALLAFSAIKNNDKVGLICFTNEVELFIPPRKGKKHVLRVVREILYFEPHQRATNINTALEYVDRVLRRKSVVFLISDFRDSGYEKRLQVTSKRHDLIAVIIQDPREGELSDVGLIELTDAETGEVVILDTRHAQTREMYRQLNLNVIEARRKQFRSNRIDSIEIRTHESYVEPLMRFFHQRAARGSF